MQRALLWLNLYGCEAVRHLTTITTGPKFLGFVLRCVELIDAKDIDVAQPIWLSGCPT